MSVRSARAQGEGLAETLGFKKPPVDVEKVAKHLGLKIVEAHLGYDVSGLLISSKTSTCIAVQEDHPSYRKRFTIGHEIGHFFLRHQFPPGQHVHIDHEYVITPRNSRSKAGIDPKEIEANQFAASLLMPSKLLLAEIESKKMKPLLDRHVTELAEKFEVSEQAMTIRLSTLGLL